MLAVRNIKGLFTPSQRLTGRARGHVIHAAAAPTEPNPARIHHPASLRTPCTNWMCGTGMQTRQMRQRKTASQHAASSDASDSPPSSEAPAADKSKKSTIFTLPTMLTILRVFAIPVLVAAFYSTHPASAPVCSVLFTAAAITDWLDGYLARKMNVVSAFGAFLDPVADKLMVAATLVLLSTRPIPVGPMAGDAFFIPMASLAIIGREITMSALREWAAALGDEARKAVAVNNLGKWKTATQMVSLAMLLYISQGATDQVAIMSATAGPILLGVAAALTVWSLVVYMKGLWPYLSS